MNSPKVAVKGLCKVFGSNPALAQALLAQGATREEVLAQTGQVVGVHDASFDVREGEIFVLMGLSGSGKSTLIRLINRLIEPTAGKVIIDGHDISALRRPALTALRRADMSMVFQSFALMPQRTVLSNAAFGLEVAGMGRKAREKRALDVLEQVGLTLYAKKLPSELSGGMQQRVGLARALAVNPSLMIMDEAFSALDPLKRKEMQNVLLALQKTWRRTIIFVSHDLEEALRIGSRIAIMEGGRIVQIGTPQQIIAHPADDYVRAFFESVDTSRYLTAGDLVQNADAPNEPDAPNKPTEPDAPDAHGAPNARSAACAPRNAQRVPDVPTIALTAAHTDATASAAAIAAALNGGASYAFVLDAERRVRGLVTREAAHAAASAAGASANANASISVGVGASALPAALQPVESLARDMPLEQVITRVCASRTALPVVDAAGRYCGAIDQASVLKVMTRSRGTHG